MADRPSNVEMIFGDPWHNRERKETARHNRATEAAASERIQKDRDVAESRRKTAKEIAEIRANSAKDRLEHDQIVEERRTAELEWKIARGQTTDAAKQAEIDRKYIQKDKELAQKQLESKQKVEHWKVEEGLAQEKYDNPHEAHPDWLDVDLPGGGKQRIHRGQPAWDSYFKKQDDADTQRKADEARPWWKRIGGGHAPVPPPAALPDSNAVPSQINQMRPPPLTPPPIQRAPFTGTTPAPPSIEQVPETAPENAPVPNPINQRPVPPMPGTETGTTPPGTPSAQAPQYIVPPPVAPAEPAAPYAPVQNFWSGLADRMSPPDATPPGGIAQWFFQGLGRGIHEAQARKAAKDAAKRAPVPGVGPQMVAPPAIGSGASGQSPVAPIQTDNWMENSLPEAAPAVAAPTPQPPIQPYRPAVKIPQGAIDHLKKNPGLTNQFDELFGAGAAQSILTP